MISRQQRSFLLAVMAGLTAVFISLGVFGTLSPALAQEPELAIKAPISQAPSRDTDIHFIAVFTDPPAYSIQDLDGIVIGEGTHEGQVRCRNNCNQKTQLQLNGSEYEYQFKTREAVDLDERRVVVAGMGTINRNGQKERFLFTATFQDNRDGTVWVRYEASRSDASFIVPNSPGTYTLEQ